MSSSRKIPIVPILIGIAFVVLTLSPVLYGWSRSPSDTEARELALDAVPGEVVALEREAELISVTVRASDGSLLEVSIDARDGEVREVEPIDVDQDDGTDEHASSL